MMFSLDERQTQALNEWVKTLPEAYAGAIGGRLTFSFTPTSLGTVVKVRDGISDKEVDLTDYDW